VAPCSRSIRALIDEQVGPEDPQLVEQALGVVEVSERSGEVAPGVRGQSALLARGCVLGVLAAFGVQRLGPRVVPVGPLDIAHGQVHRGPPDHGTHFPDQVARAGQQPDGGLGVAQRLGVATQDPQGADPADQDPAGQDATAAPDQIVQDRQAALGLAAQNQGHGQAGGDVGLALQVSGLTGEPAGLPELADRLADITEVPEDHASRLVRHGGLRRRRMPGQHLAGRGQRLRRPRQGQGQELVWLPGPWGGSGHGRHL